MPWQHQSLGIKALKHAQRRIQEIKGINWHSQKPKCLLVIFVLVLLICETRTCLQSN